MAEADGISLEDLGILAERAGMPLTPAELEGLKPMFDYYAAQLRVLHAVDLGDEDVAGVYSPGSSPEVLP